MRILRCNARQLLTVANPTIYCTFDGAADIGVFHAMAGMAAAMPGLKKFPSAGKEIEANR